MIKEYFLSANSGGGFYSLYDSFPPDDCFLHIIKGGPGTGKSTFMRKIGQKAESLGLKVQYVLCSGDSFSLDGIFIPQIHIAFADGTAPHTLDVRQFGVDSDYVNLGRFCKSPVSDVDKARVRSCAGISKESYSRAYLLLSAASHAKRAYMPAERASHERRKLEDKVREILRGASCCGGMERRLFLSAISREGRIELYQNAVADYKYVFSAEELTGEASVCISAAVEEAEILDLNRIVCPDPLMPDSIEAVLLPECSFAILRSDLTGLKLERLEAEGQLISNEERKLFQCGITYERELIQRASEYIHIAGNAHDELESIYRPYVNLNELNEFEDEYIDRIFRSNPYLA